MDLWGTTIGDPYQKEKNLDLIPMFAWFVERGLMMPASDFFKGMPASDFNGHRGLVMLVSDFNDIKYLNLNPNEIFHTSIFVHFREAFMGIKPHWILFRKFFRMKPQPSTDDPRVVGGVGTQMREDATGQYLSY
jgi:hypothetical protein